MLLLHYRTVSEGMTLPVDQRWRTVELDPEMFAGLDLESPQGVSAAIRRINDGKIGSTVGSIAPFPHGAEVYLTDTEKVDHWELTLQIQKAT